MIKELNRNDIPQCVQVIRDSFQTVADEFGFTADNAPGFTAFSTTETKLLQWMEDQHRPMFGYYDENGELIGYYNLLVQSDRECELGSLCVLPDHRHCGIGKKLLNDSLARAKAYKCIAMKLSIVEENSVLRRWYEKNGFVHTGTKKFDFFPFTCGYMEKTL